MVAAPAAILVLWTRSEDGLDMSCDQEIGLTRICAAPMVYN